MAIIHQVWVKVAEPEITTAFTMVRSLSLSNTFSEGNITWKALPPDWVKVNSDGSVITQEGRALCGGVV